MSDMHRGIAVGELFFGETRNLISKAGDGAGVQMGPDGAGRRSWSWSCWACVACCLLLDACCLLAPPACSPFSSVCQVGPVHSTQVASSNKSPGAGYVASRELCVADRHTHTQSEPLTLAACCLLACLLPRDGAPHLLEI